MDKIKIFLAEDHSVVREGVKMLINAQPDMTVIGEASDGREAVTKVLELDPDVVILDVTMPVLTGTSAAIELKQKKPDILILALSVHEDKSYFRELFQAGISGYVLKRSAANELINAIRIVSSGGIYLDPSIAGKVVSEFVDPSEPVTFVAEGQLLSQREREVLRLIAHGYTNKEIASELNISIKTVETYRSRAMQKIGLNSRADIVRFAVQAGWLTEEM